MSIGRFELLPGYSISRVIPGGWHRAGAYGKINQAQVQALTDVRRLVKVVISTFNCADIYDGVEALIGAFLRAHEDAFKSSVLPPVQVHTKYVPNYDAL